MISRPHRPAWATAALCLVLCLVPASRAAWANWESDYKDGKIAYEKGDYKEAIKLLRSAIDDKPKEKDKAVRISGMFFDPYLPHFYLGMAFLKTEQFGKAVSEFETSESMGVIGKLDELNDTLRKSKSLAAASLEERQQVAQKSEPEPPPAAPASPTAGSATGAQTNTAPGQPAAGKGASGEDASKGPKVGKAQPMPTPGKEAGNRAEEDLRKARAAAAEDLAGAQKFVSQSGNRLNSAERQQIESLSREIRDARSADEASRKTAELRTTLGDLKAKVETRRKADEEAVAAKAVAAARNQAAPAVREAEEFGRSNRSNLESAEAAGLDRRIGAVKSADSANGIRQATRQLQSELSKLKEQVSARAATKAGLSAKEQYASGATAYFEGRYDAAVAALRQASRNLENDPEPHAILGSALYKQYLLGRPQDDQLKAQAESEFKAALAIKKDYKLDENYFPPKVIAFFRQVSGGR